MQLEIQELISQRITQMTNDKDTELNIAAQNDMRELQIQIRIKYDFALEQLIALKNEIWELGR